MFGYRALPEKLPLNLWVLSFYLQFIRHQLEATAINLHACVKTYFCSSGCDQMCVSSMASVKAPLLLLVNVQSLTNTDIGAIIGGVVGGLCAIVAAVIAAFIATRTLNKRHAAQATT